MITKLVDPDEIGKILAFVAGIQAFVPLVSSSIFGLIYRNTVEFAPNTHYFVIAFLFLIDLSILLAIDYGMVRLEQHRKREEKEEAELREEMLARKSRPISLNYD